MMCTDRKERIGMPDFERLTPTALLPNTLAADPEQRVLRKGQSRRWAKNYTEGGSGWRWYFIGGSIGNWRRPNAGSLRWHGACWTAGLAGKRRKQR